MNIFTRIARPSREATVILAAALLAVSFGAPATAFAFEPRVEASKPTNFFNALDHTGELQSLRGGDIFAYRFLASFAPGEKHSLFAEIPLLDNEMTDKSGIGDDRFGNFWLPYKDYNRFVGAFGPSIEFQAPTGKANDGLGAGGWTVLPGITTGLMLDRRFQLFPVLAYQYFSEPDNDLLPEEERKARHGMVAKAIIPIQIHWRFYCRLTAEYSINDFDHQSLDRITTEMLFGFYATPGWQVGGSFKADPEDRDYYYRMFVTQFLR